MSAYDAVVIGAGPAGLSAAAELSAQGRCLLLDEGPAAAARDRNAPVDLLSGVGGAGLFSDGKHSFFPSASALWTLPDQGARARAFEQTAALLERYGVSAGSLPPSAPPVASELGVWRAKEYRSVYVSLSDRFRMIDELWSRAGHAVSGARLVDCARSGPELELAYEQEGRLHRVITRNLVIATGRWSPRWIRPWLYTRLGATFAFLRVEFGVRIETSADSALFARLPGVDGKLRFVEPAAPLEIRTFCTCRNGEVTLGEAWGMRAFSGRADGPPSGRSNVGLVVRTTDPQLGNEVTSALAVASPQSFALAEWQQHGAARISPVFGNRAAVALTTALARLESFCPQLAEQGGRVYAPALEGVGEYPIDDGSLQVAEGVWIAGDVGGRFRGIVAAMVSGRYAARRILTTAS